MAQWTGQGQPEPEAIPVGGTDRDALAAKLHEARVTLGQARSQAQTPMGKLASTLTKDDHQVAGRVEIADEARWQQSLGRLGSEWESAVRETRVGTHREQLQAALGNGDIVVTS